MPVVHLAAKENAREEEKRAATKEHREGIVENPIVEIKYRAKGLRRHFATERK